MYSFSYLEPVCRLLPDLQCQRILKLLHSCTHLTQFCYFLTCIQASQEAGQVVWYSHLLQNFLQFIVIYTVRGFGIINKEEIDVFLKLSCFFNDSAMLAISPLAPLPFLNPAWTSGSSRFVYCYKSYVYTMLKSIKHTVVSFLQSTICIPAFKNTKQNIYNSNIKDHESQLP